MQAEKAERKKPTCPKCHSSRYRWPCEACGYSPTPQELFEAEARARAIEADSVAQAEKSAKTLELATKFRAATPEERYQFFLRMVAKYGPRRAVGVYRWWSGETSWPAKEWKLASGFYGSIGR
jgi:methionyl-tRNA synthetase